MYWIERSRQMTVLAEYKALAGAVLDGSHSYEDFLKAGEMIYSPRRMLALVLAADSVNGKVKR